MVCTRRRGPGGTCKYSSFRGGVDPYRRNSAIDRVGGYDWMAGARMFDRGGAGTGEGVPRYGVSQQFWEKGFAGTVPRRKS